MCQYPVSCAYWLGYEWDPYSCKCIKRHLWWEWQDTETDPIDTTTISASTTTTSIPTDAPTLPPIDGCADSIIKSGECLYEGQVKYSCNGCFKIVIENGNLVVYYNNVPGVPPVWTSNYTNGLAVKACAENPNFVFYGASMQLWIILFTGPVDAKLLDNGQMMFAQRGTNSSFTYGTSASCYPTTTTQTETTTETAFEGTTPEGTTTDETTTFIETSVAPLGPCNGNRIVQKECLYPGQAKCSKNGCFKFVVENGDLVVYKNTMPPVFVWRSNYTNGQALRACTENNIFSTPPLWTIHFNNGIEAEIQDDGLLVFYENGVKQSFTVGIPSTCAESTDPPTETTPFEYTTYPLTEERKYNIWPFETLMRL